MGSGASATPEQIHEKLSNASPEELKSAVAALSPEAFKKLESACNQTSSGPKMDFKPENIQLWFKYEFLDTTDAVSREKVYTVLDNLNKHFIEKGAFGPVNMQLLFLRTEKGWEAWEAFTDGTVYAKHVENCMSSPYFEELMGYQGLFQEKDAWIMGLESELAKAPQLAEFYPTQRRIHQSPNLKGDMTMTIGWKNEGDGADDKKRGGPIVVEYEIDYKSPDCKDKVMPILKEADDAMVKFEEFGSLFLTLSFQHTPTGYKLIEILRDGASYDKHCANLMSDEGLIPKIMSLMGLTDIKHQRLHGLKAELESSPGIMGGPLKDVERVYGTPIPAAWGKPHFGWSNDPSDLY